MSEVIPSVLPNSYDLMGNTLRLVSNKERCERKIAVAIFWLGLCNISTVSLDSKSVSGVHKPHTLPLLSLALCGDIWLTIWISVLEFVHTANLFLTTLYFSRLLQRGIYRCSPAAMIHASKCLHT
jgi:hypothetical protein